jgi:hypothetical protein
MKSLIKCIFHTILFLTLIVSLTNCNQNKNPSKEQEDSEYYSVDDFSSVEKFDTHVHFNMFDTTFLKQAEADNFRLITINVSPDYYPPIEEQLRIGSQLSKQHPERISFATTFSIKNFNDDNWQQQTLGYIKRSIAEGAIAVKVWKNIGMELKDKNGKFVMIDNPKFDTIFNFIAQNKLTLIGHLGEPRNCWLPVEKMTVKGDKEYFASHPKYHMYLHPEYPSYEDQINARDHMLAKHPDMLFVGAHLGSLEWSVDELAKRLDKYPNMAVDMAQRISHLQYQAVANWQKVHDFFIKYQDRLLYATDQEVDTTKTPEQRNKEAHEIWLRHWKFFTQGETMKVPKVEKEFKGMRLPKSVVDKIYKLNAQKWFAGIPKTPVSKL